MKKTCLYTLVAVMLLLIVLPIKKINVIIKNPFKVEEVISNINSDVNWYNSIEKKAKKNKVSLKEQIFFDAVYILKQDERYKKVFLKKTDSIKSNKKIFSEIKAKAKKNKNSVKFQLCYKVHYEIENNYIEILKKEE